MDEATLADLYAWVDAVAQQAAVDAIWNHVNSTALESFDQLQEDRTAARNKEYGLRLQFMAHFAPSDPLPQVTTVYGDGPDDILYDEVVYPPSADDTAWHLSDSPGEPNGPFFCENCSASLDDNVQYCEACA